MEKYTLKTARDRLKLTQKEAANKIGISEDTLSNYERGKSYPDIPTLKRIEEVYEVTYNQLIFLPQNNGKTVNRKI
ncbi:helix-turn-helix domain-containing protein [Faecalibacillus intestinalis]|uniref:helix-turn-helix domain-containing protein n=1 Tax=Faecalibacillus intestinalis TaxID=1982626 RepID=UPI000E4147EA|nr:helix-turn-helix transcriptional regulator [Faecalibacillus intestinalis]RGF27451.1 XRE family transcriptional regulator [Coprobacillus sp. AM09-26]